MTIGYYPRNIREKNIRKPAEREQTTGESHFKSTECESTLIYLCTLSLRGNHKCLPLKTNETIYGFPLYTLRKASAPSANETRARERARLHGVRVCLTARWHTHTRAKMQTILVYSIYVVYDSRPARPDICRSVESACKHYGTYYRSTPICTSSTISDHTPLRRLRWPHSYRLNHGGAKPHKP